MFVGRDAETAALNDVLTTVRNTDRAQPGQMIALFGRRRVGKSLLVDRFVGQTDVPSVYFQIDGASAPRSFAKAVRASSLRDADLASNSADDWDAALRSLAVAVGDGPAIVVIDEVPYAIEHDPAFEATLQAVWDRRLANKRVLLILIGSDMSVMKALTAYERPLYGRAIPMRIDPLSPMSSATIVGIDDPIDVLDAYLMTGGFPSLCADWRDLDVERAPFALLRRSLENPSSSLITNGERIVNAEFPSAVPARDALTAIGTGEATYANIERAMSVAATTTSAALRHLVDKQIVAADMPLDATGFAQKTKRYRVADQHLRFWLRFVGPNRNLLDRQRADLVMARIDQPDLQPWLAYRGRAVEPLLRDAAERMIRSGRLDLGLPDTSQIEVGGWWPRNNTPEIDLVVTDGRSAKRKVVATGTFKWRTGSGVTQSDINAHLAVRSAVRGVEADTPVIAVGTRHSNAHGALVVDAEQVVESLG